MKREAFFLPNLSEDIVLIIEGVSERSIRFQMQPPFMRIYDKCFDLAPQSAGNLLLCAHRYIPRVSTRVPYTNVP
ncbi:MAG: hypothetical protein A2Z14_13725 [Chloroflexi bacterium RBG_16_48_8]|nr:MAG: hypothetical protein A2Z14_13725 [Chloroflexi bacterium RBG_16_48_8]